MNFRNHFRDIRLTIVAGVARYFTKIIFFNNLAKILSYLFRHPDRNNMRTHFLAMFSHSDGSNFINYTGPQMVALVL